MALKFKLTLKYCSAIWVHFLTNHVTLHIDISKGLTFLNLKFHVHYLTFLSVSMLFYFLFTETKIIGINKREPILKHSCASTHYLSSCNSGKTSTPDAPITT